MITTIVFDFGGVIVADHTKELRKLALRRGIPKHLHKRYVRLFHQTERGERPTKDLLPALRDAWMPGRATEELQERILTTKVLPPWRLAQQLGKKYRVIIFSNNQKAWPREIGKRLKQNFFQFAFVNSARCGMRKPEPRFYRYLVKRFKLEASETAFIDDRAENLGPAWQMGMQVFHYTNNPAALKRWFKKVGVRV